MPNNLKKPWHADPDIGCVKDAVIAERHGVPAKTVAAYRNRNGIPPADKTPAWVSDPRFGKIADVDFALVFGASRHLVRYWRQKYGFADPSDREGRQLEAKEIALSALTADPNQSNRKIAENFGVHRQVVQEVRNVADLQKRTRADEIRSLFQQGKTVSQIASVLEVSYQQVYTALSRAGLL